MSDLSYTGDTEPVRRDLFLHVCCGPCAEWPVKSFLDEGLSLTAFYYNPNIHPLFEHDRRRDNAARLMQMHNIPFITDDTFLEDEWKAKAWEGRFPSRCEMCYDIRMRRTAEEARKQGFTAFSTTLLVSPYQNHEGIIKAALRAADENGISFVYRDFRPGFREGQRMAKEDGLYRQKYCGCIFSLEESEFRDKIYRDFAGSSGDTSKVL